MPWNRFVVSHSYLVDIACSCGIHCQLRCDIPVSVYFRLVVQLGLHIPSCYRPRRYVHYVLLITHTILTIFFLAFDQDLNSKAALAFPQLYISGIRGLEYTRLKFWLYMLDGFYQSAVVYFVAYFVWTLGPAISWNGKTIESLADYGTTIAVSAIFAANLYVGINTH